MSNVTSNKILHTDSSFFLATNRHWLQDLHSSLGILFRTAGHMPNLATLYTVRSSGALWLPFDRQYFRYPEEDYLLIYIVSLVPKSSGGELSLKLYLIDFPYSLAGDL